MEQVQPGQTGGDVPAEPVVAIDVRPDGTVLVDGVPVEHDGSRSPHQVATDAVAERVAAPRSRPVRAVATDASGRTAMVVHPDGAVTDVYLESGLLPSYAPPAAPADDEPAAVDEATRPRRDVLDAQEGEPGAGPAPAASYGAAPAAPSAAPTWGLPPTAATPGPVITSTPLTPTTAPAAAAPPPTPATAPAPAAAPTTAPAAGPEPVYATRAARRAAETERPASRSFLTRHEEVAPAQRGLRGFMARLGMSTSPSEAELAERRDVQVVSRHWPGPRTIAVVNGKGGAGKTPTTVLLSALFARHGGSGVLAWDNNETRGTLGWRTEQGPHEAHVLDLLPHADRLMQPTARAADLAAFVHHQTHDKFDVLRSNPTMLPHQQRLTAEDFDAVHRVATKYFRLIFVDSGNDETAPHWLRMIDHADQVVLATTTRPDHAEAGRLLLDALRVRDEHSARLAENAVAVVSQADREEASADTIAEGYAGQVRATVTIPYDRALRAPWLRFDSLQPATRRAYLRAAAAVAEGL